MNLDKRESFNNQKKKQPKLLSFVRMKINLLLKIGTTTTNLQQIITYFLLLLLLNIYTLFIYLFKTIREREKKRVSFNLSILLI